MQIEIDFEVYKALTLRRETEDHSYNDVLRSLLGLGGSVAKDSPNEGASVQGCLFKGVMLPDGTELRARYKGRLHSAKIVNGEWVDESGRRQSSPSRAANAITGTQVNGWRFWDFKRPSDSSWRRLSVLLDSREG